MLRDRLMKRTQTLQHLRHEPENWSCLEAGRFIAWIERPKQGRYTFSQRQEQTAPHIQCACAFTSLHLPSTKSPSSNAVAYDQPLGATFWIHTIPCPDLRIMPTPCIDRDRQHQSKNGRSIHCHLSLSTRRLHAFMP
jgi:hypothetical protein